MTLRDKLNSLRIFYEDKDELFSRCVTERLTRSKDIYEEVLEKNCSYILSRNNLKVIRSLNRYEKRKEKNNEKEAKFGFIECM